MRARGELEYNIDSSEKLEHDVCQVPLIVEILKAFFIHLDRVVSERVYYT